MIISHWYGRLGNNIQQCAVGTMAAALTQSTFESIEHEIIKRRDSNISSFFIKVYLYKIYLYYVINQYSYEKFCFNNFFDIIH